MPQLFTFRILCDICGTQNGEIILDRKFHNESNVTNEYLNIADARCDADNIKHGTFKEALEKAKAVLGTDEKAEEFAKKFRKKADFDKEIKKISVVQ